MAGARAAMAASAAAGGAHGKEPRVGGAEEGEHVNTVGCGFTNFVFTTEEDF